MQSYHVCHNRLLANEEESIYGHYLDRLNTSKKNGCRMRDRDDATRMPVINTPDRRRAQVFQRVCFYRYLLVVIYTLQFDEKSGHLDLIQRLLLVPAASKPLKNMASPGGFEPPLPP